DDGESAHADGERVPDVHPFAVWPAVRDRREHAREQVLVRAGEADDPAHRRRDYGRARRALSPRTGAGYTSGMARAWLLVAVVFAAVVTAISLFPAAVDDISPPSAPRRTGAPPVIDPVLPRAVGSSPEAPPGPPFAVGVVHSTFVDT